MSRSNTRYQINNRHQPGSISAKSFDVLIDGGPMNLSVIGVRVDPVAGAPFVLPMDYDTAFNLAELMLSALWESAPDLFAGKFEMR